MILLTLDDALLCIAPTNPKIEQLLTYEKKILEKNPKGYGMVTRREKREIFQRKTQEGVEAVITHQGMWWKMMDLCQEQGWPFELRDLRLKMQLPDYTKMHGFRFSQEALLKQALQFKCSGCVKAPTRYGKTSLMLNTLRAFPGIPTVVTCPGIDLLKQTTEDFRKGLPGREIVMIGGGSRVKFSSEDITVCSMDSLDKCDAGMIRLLLIDEPHSAITETRAPGIIRFTHARKLGFGATLEGRYDNADLSLEAIIGPTLAERTYVDAVAEGAICEIVIIMLRVKLNPGAFRGINSRDGVYGRGLYDNPHIRDLVRQMLNDVIPPEDQTIVFIDNEDQADGMMRALNPETTVAMAKKLTPKERTAITEQMRYGKITRCLASIIYSTGVTFHDLKVVINAAGGGGNISAVQKPGRLAEIRPGKKCGVMIDFMFEEDIQPHMPGESGNPTWKCLINDSYSRLSVYKEKGYTILWADQPADVRRHLENKTQ